MRRAAAVRACRLRPNGVRARMERPMMGREDRPMTVDAVSDDDTTFTPTTMPRVTYTRGEDTASITHWFGSSLCSRGGAIRIHIISLMFCYPYIRPCL